MRLSMRNASKAYGSGAGRVLALDDVSLDVGAGEFVCLWGPSGSGKSTLLNVLGLLDGLDSGEYRFSGEDVTKLSPRQTAAFRNKNLGFVFQSYNLIPVLSAVENVMFPLQVRGMSESESRASANALLERVGLEQQAERRPDQLSGGQRQRVAIARALIGEPTLVLADEPTANLDSETSEQILALLTGLNRERATTFVLATHDPDLAQYASRHVYLRDGRVVDSSAQGSEPIRRGA